MKYCFLEENNIQLSLGSASMATRQGDVHLPRGVSAGESVDCSDEDESEDCPVLCNVDLSDEIFSCSLLDELVLLS